MKNKTTKTKAKRLPKGTWLNPITKSRIDSRLFIPLVVISEKYDNTYIERNEAPTKKAIQQTFEEMLFLEKGLTYDKVEHYLIMIGTGKAIAPGYNSENAKYKTELESVRKWRMKFSK